MAILNLGTAIPDTIPIITTVDKISIKVIPRFDLKSLNIIFTYHTYYKHKLKSCRYLP